MKYVELHARSAFSFLEGASTPEELAAGCAHLEIPAMALLDRDGVYGSPRFHMAAQKTKLRAHIGAEVTSTDGWRYPLLVETREGYQNLCRLITRMKLRAAKGEGSVSAEEVNEHARGLIFLTGGAEGPLAHALLQGGMEAATKCVQKLCSQFSRENVYVELQRHFSREEEVRNQAAVAIARKLSLPLLATGGACYAQAYEREILDVFTAIRHHRTLDTAGRLLSVNAERHLKPPAEMARIFADLPEAIANTETLSTRLQFTLKDLGYQFPKYPVPDGGSEIDFLRQRTYEGMIHRYGSDNERARRQIEHELQIIAKLDLAGYFLIVWDIVRFCREQKILVQGRGSAANSAVCYSLGITAVDPVGMDLLFERFLSEERGEWPDIDLDLPSGDQRERAIQYVYHRYGQLGAAMTANVITYRGRSAAREIGKALSFEPETLDRLAQVAGHWEYQDVRDTLDRRFRDAGFDLQHPLIRKFAELCQQVQDLPRHLGQHSGGMVICQGQLDSVVPLEPATMPGRVVVQWDKDDCCDMGIVKVDLLGLGMMAVLEESLEIIKDKHGETIDLGKLPADDPAVYAALQKADTVGMFQIESRAQMSCLPRLHPKHFYDIVVQVAIIRPGPIVGKMVNPYLKRRQGKEPVSYAHPLLEPVLARTLGVPLFQEQLLRMAMITANFSGGEAEDLRRAMGFKRSEARMREIEKKLRRGMEANGISPERQEEIIQSITSFALYGFPESHAASFALIAYASAYLKCHYLAAFTAAILNNQPMGFYQPATLVKDAQRHGLKVRPIDVMHSNWGCTLEPIKSETSGAKAPNWEASNISWLKPQPTNPDSETAEKTTRFVDHAFRHEITASFPSGVLTRDGPNRPRGSKSEFEPEQAYAMRLGLRYAKGLREEIGKEIVRQRNLQPFASVDDLQLRVPAIHKDELVALAAIGAFNGITGEKHRRDALWQVERSARRPGPLLETIPQSQSTEGYPESAQADDVPAFRSVEKAGSSVKTSPPNDALFAHSPLARMTLEERLVADFHGTGMTVGKHPMAYHRSDLNRQGISLAIELCKIPDGSFVRVAGAVIARQRPGTAKGFVFLSLEDETGIANAIVTPQLFEREYLTLVKEPFLIVEGTLQNQENTISVKASRVLPLAITQTETVSHDFH